MAYISANTTTSVTPTDMIDRYLENVGKNSENTNVASTSPMRAVKNSSATRESTSKNSCIKRIKTPNKSKKYRDCSKTGITVWNLDFAEPVIY
jgi:hypothetical protein